MQRRFLEERAARQREVAAHVATVAQVDAARTGSAASGSAARPSARSSGSTPVSDPRAGGTDASLPPVFDEPIFIPDAPPPGRRHPLDVVDPWEQAEVVQPHGPTHAVNAHPDGSVRFPLDDETPGHDHAADERLWQQLAAIPDRPTPPKPLPASIIPLARIYFERQQDAMCGVHCINNLLQGAHVTQLDLFQVSTALDEQEKALLREGGVDSVDYLRQFEEDSHNCTGEGNFSVDVLRTALRDICGLELEAVGQLGTDGVLEDPCTERAFILNHAGHWYSIRRFGEELWYELNSLSKGPRSISPAYLSLLLSQLMQEGFSLFVVRGEMPLCEAEELALQLSGGESAPFPGATPPAMPSVLGDPSTRHAASAPDAARGAGTGATATGVPPAPPPAAPLVDEQQLTGMTEEEALQAALAASMQAPP